MNSRGAHKIWRSILRKKGKREKISIRCTTKKEVGMQNLGSRGGSPATGSTGKVEIFRRDLLRNWLDLGMVWDEILWGIDGEGRGIFMGQNFMGKEQPEMSPRR